MHKASLLLDACFYVMGILCMLRNCAFCVPVYQMLETSVMKDLPFVHLSFAIWVNVGRKINTPVTFCDIMQLLCYGNTLRSFHSCSQNAVKMGIEYFCRASFLFFRRGRHRFLLHEVVKNNIANKGTHYS